MTLTAETCERAPSGSLWPCTITRRDEAAQHKHRAGEWSHCRDCGREVRYSRFGKWEHRA